MIRPDHIQVFVARWVLIPHSDDSGGTVLCVAVTVDHCKIGFVIRTLYRNANTISCLLLCTNTSLQECKPSLEV